MFNWGNINLKKSVSIKEVKQHIKTLKNKGWGYQGITGE
jgi:hypothetical protein